ncbi:hypothetical protein GALL_425650 [mine drainage metagenome]|uniref:Carboxypeptidase regulatory-like domain-containing protein n=1 Tax=mine drainage metagenome TaxID=410659 RepID=A0A1J5PXY5_9ZZZZ
MKLHLFRKALPLAVGAWVMMGTLAQAATYLPPVHRSGTVDYLTGGIGLDESTAIQSVSKKWPLTLEFAIKDKNRADYAAGVHIVMRNAHQHPALQVTSEGPFLLAKVTPGDYTVDASLAGKTLHRKVVVTAGQPTKVVFLWPTGTGVSHS